MLEFFYALRFILTKVITMHLSLKILLLTLGLIQSLIIPAAQAKEQIDIGILAFRPKPQVEARWLPLTTYLNNSIQSVDFKIKPLNYTELEDAVINKQVDFVFTNSSHFVQLAEKVELSSPLATLINKKSGQPVRAFAGTILVKANNDEIQQVSDLKNKIIATPSTKSFGGYQMQAYELQQAGLDIPSDISIIQTTMPHDKAVYAVLNDQADAAFVRSGVFESLINQGEISSKDLKLINLSNESDFPFLASTRLYPEWPFLAMPHVGEELAGKVTAALLKIPQNGEIAQAINIHGFRIPADYEPVREVLRTLKVYPFDKNVEITFSDLWKQHQALIIISSLSLITILLLSLVILRTHNKLHRSHQELQNKNESLRLSAVAFETQESIFITDPQQRIIKVNNAFSRVTGYSEQEVIGKTPSILKSGKHNELFYAHLWQELESNGFWQGEVWNRRKNGEVFPVGQTITAVKDDLGNTSHYISTFEDITAFKENEERIKKLAFYDPLTGLANRRLLNDHLKQARANSSRHQTFFALIFIDLDHFKNLNDTLGHDVGDLLLKQVSNRLLNSVRESDTVSRNGGDEFVILLQELSHDYNTSAKFAKHIADKILQQLSIPYQLRGKEYSISASIGITLSSDHDETIEEIMIRSDLAMYNSKSLGRNTVSFFDPSMQEAINKRIQDEKDLRQAIENKEFRLFYQPKHTQNGDLLGFEALLRWQHPSLGLLEPDSFLETAEDSGILFEIGLWTLNTVCKQLAAWAKEPDLKHLTIAINLAECQIRRDDFIDSVTQTLGYCTGNTNKLEFEITESTLMKHLDKAAIKLEKLKEYGITLSIDDFGTGYSSLNYLKKLPIDSIKVDRSFIKDMLNDPHDEVIVKTILALTENLGIDAVAEGVEHENQRDYLAQLGYQVFQGNLFSKPKPLEEIDLNSFTKVK